jgi:outer membrane lipoprotein SlyB
MKTKILLVALMAALAFTSCKKDNDKPSDVYAEFKADAIPRWENGTAVELSDASTNTFIVDNGTLFSSAKYKVGRITAADGSAFEFIEFDGPAAAGVKSTGATLRKPSGITALASLEILKVDDKGKLWIVFKETASGTERRVVQ